MAFVVFSFLFSIRSFGRTGAEWSGALRDKIIGSWDAEHFHFHSISISFPTPLTYSYSALQLHISSRRWRDGLLASDCSPLWLTSHVFDCAFAQEQLDTLNQSSAAINELEAQYSVRDAATFLSYSYSYSYSDCYSLFSALRHKA